MPSPMSQDPYRTLGLEPGASMADVKRAYRRLAKVFHPDSAGEDALPRFLAIHEAYERIRTGRPAAAPAAGWADAAPTAEPWRADPARARAARERASSARGRAGATGAAGTPRSRTGARASGGPPPGAGAGPAGAGRGAGAAGPAASPGAGPRSERSQSGPETSGPTRSGTGYGGRASRRGERRKATLGSTSYDEAHDPRDASWSGASWYGPTSGEYWIINPREYADPRKHGPSYQARVRKSTGTTAAGVPADVDDAAFEEVTWDDVDGGRRAADGGRAADGVSSGPADPAGPTSGRAARSRSGAASEPRPSAPPGPTAARWSGPGPRRGGWDEGLDAAPTWSPVWRPPSRGRETNLGIRELLGGPADDPIRRLGLALVAWPPIGLAAAATIGDVTGCASFSAACAGTDTLLPWLAQAGILGLLLLLPPIARLLAGGAVAVVLALVPVTGFLVVVGGAGEPQAGFALAFLLALAWLLGVGWSIAMARRRERPFSVGGPS